MIDPAAFWNKVAEKYARSPVRDAAAYEYTLGRSRSYLKPTDKVLELGCGTGTTALVLAPDVAQLTGLDISEAMIAIARQKAAAQGVGNIRFDLGGEVPGEGPFDVVMAHSLFHLLPDMEARFAQIHSLLPEGGYFISKTACLGEKGEGIGGAFKAGLIRFAIPVMQRLGKAPYVRRFDVYQLETAVRAAGFEIVESGSHPKGPPPAHYIVARKL